jgi:hypothetical protein
LWSVVVFAELIAISLVRRANAGGPASVQTASPGGGV